MDNNYDFGPGWGAIGSPTPTIENAEETLKLTDKDIAHVYRYDELLDKILSEFGGLELKIERN